jgi:hypothetical protein
MWVATGVLIAMSIGLPGCFPAGPAVPYRAKERLRGMTESELLACAGPPMSQTVQGRMRVLTYERTGAPGVCRAIISLTGNRVTDVRYEAVMETGARVADCTEVLNACLQPGR